MKRIAVYCGSSTGHDPGYALAAAGLGETLVARGIGLVFGGGRVGLMGVIADAVLARHGDVRGVIPEALATKELAHSGVTELFVVPSMHERKAKMAELADGFIAMPGGFGTLDETYEMLTWAQLGFHRKPVGFFNVHGYFDSLVAFTARAVADGFIKPEHGSMAIVASSPDELLTRMEGYSAPPVPKWIGLGQT
jgi:uncharacterized protein (TIGR00730 family)